MCHRQAEAANAGRDGRRRQAQPDAEMPGAVVEAHLVAPGWHEHADESAVVVSILADGGWKYLSADFWSADDVGSSMERTLWW